MKWNRFQSIFVDQIVLKFQMKSNVMNSLYLILDTVEFLNDNHVNQLIFAYFDKAQVWVMKPRSLPGASALQSLRCGSSRIDELFHDGALLRVGPLGTSSLSALQLCLNNQTKCSQVLISFRIDRELNSTKKTNL